MGNENMRMNVGSSSYMTRTVIKDPATIRAVLSGIMNGSLTQNMIVDNPEDPSAGQTVIYANNEIINRHRVTVVGDGNTIEGSTCRAYGNRCNVYFIKILSHEPSAPDLASMSMATTTRSWDQAALLLATTTRSSGLDARPQALETGAKDQGAKTKGHPSTCRCIPHPRIQKPTNLTERGLE
jgi:hypothetical protein